MARPIKKGLDYFPIDIGFLQDIKIRRIMRACGTASIPILISLLCNIYRGDGYYVLWEPDLPFLIAEEVGVSEGVVIETVGKAVQVDFFHEGLYEKFKILTSSGIQNRYLKAVERRTRVEMEQDYLLIKVNECKNVVIVGNNQIKDNRSTQSKVEESKVKDSKAVAAVQPSEASDLTPLQYYEQNISPVMTRTEVDTIDAWLADGIDPDLLKAMIDEAVESNARKLGYIRAIYWSCKKEGVTTVSQFEARKKRHKQRSKTNARSNAKGNYTDRGDLSVYEKIKPDDPATLFGGASEEEEEKYPWR